MLGIFTFVFGFVFKSKLPGAETSLTYIIWLISGYGPWLSIAEGLVASATAIIGGANLIKNMKIKSELLVIAGGAVGLVPLAVSIVYLLVLMAFADMTPSLSWLVIPFVIVLQFLLISGFGFFLAALAVFVRDVVHVLPNMLLIFMFASPIFYPLSVFPKAVQSITMFNPIYLLSEWYRQPLLHESFPPLWTLIYLIVVAGILFGVGLTVFRRLSNYFESQL
jgi:lipopolysaccharide transport system permease protein